MKDADNFQGNPFAEDGDNFKGDPFAQQATNSLGQEAARQGGLFLRNALTALGSVGAIPADAIGKAVNAVAGSEVVPNQQRALQRTLTALGLPEPAADRPIERFTQGMAQSAPSFALPTTLPAQVAGNAAISAAQAEPGQEGPQAALGGAFGAGGQVLGRTLGGIVKPTEQARVLMDRGVALTPGQAAGAGSLPARFESAMTSNPFSGAPIAAAQRRGVEEANRAAAQAVVNIVDNKVKLGLPPREAIEQTRDVIGKHYDEALSGMDTPAFFSQASLLHRLNSMATDFPLLSRKDLRQMENFVDVRVGDLAKQSGGTVTGAQLKQLDSEIGQYVRNLRNSTNAADKTAAPAWAELQQTLRDVMTFAQADPVKQQQLRNANEAYRQLLAIEKALLSGADTFTPRQLSRQLDKRGIRNTELNTVSNAMAATLPNAVPNSGTAERLLTTALPSLLLGTGAGAQSLGYDMIGTGLMAAGALGSRPGSRFMTGSLAGQQALAEALRRVTPAAVRATQSASIPTGGIEE